MEMENPDGGEGWSESDEVSAHNRLMILRSMLWTTGKAAVNAIKDLALVEQKTAIVNCKGGTFRRMRCSSATTCSWFVNVSLTRRKAQTNFWHVTTANLNHRNCTGTSTPSQRQLAASSVLRSAVIADINVSGPTLNSQLQLAANISANRMKLYRAKQDVLCDVFSDNLQFIEYLPSFMVAFAAQNPGTFTGIQRDTDGCFTRAIMVLVPVWFRSGLRIYGVDAAHMKHRKYNGVQIVLVARDGNLRNRIAAVALAPVEDHANYFWFFDAVLSRGFPLRDVPVFSDRHTGIISAATELRVFNIFCTRHIIGGRLLSKLPTPTC